MAALEMIHTYSLVHDDLPAMDNDDYRRGRKTTHVVYGEDMGILAGDALLNYAFETACKAFDLEPENSLRIGRALKILAEKAGIYGMIGGQVVDVRESGHRISGDLLEFIPDGRDRREDRAGIPDPGRYPRCDRNRGNPRQTGAQR